MSRTLDARDIRRLRLSNHWLAPRPAASAVEIAEHLGALQSQEIWSGRWSFGARSNALDQVGVDEATEDGSVLRTWPLRNTVHFIPGVDANWMLAVAETYAYKGIERRREHLGLSEDEALRAVEVLRGALAHGEPVTRKACLDALSAAGLLTEPGHGYHLTWFAAQHGVSCFGPMRGSEQTFVDLAAWVREPRELNRDEALAELAVRYFRSHGPVAAKDLRRWTALGAKDTNRGIELADDRLCSVATEFGPMLMGSAEAASIESSGVDAPDPDRSILLLSGFDEYLLGYQDRRAILDDGQLKRIVPGNNGIFRPTIIDDGKVIGVWSRKVTKTRVTVTVEPFGRFTKAQRGGIERAAHEYGDFLALEATIVEA